MLHKIGLALLAIAVFCYALYLIARKKPLPEPLPEKGLRRRFFLATAVCMTMLGANGCRSKPEMSCYAQTLPSDAYLPEYPDDYVPETLEEESPDVAEDAPRQRPFRHLSLDEIRRAMRAIWISLDVHESQRFDDLANEAIARGAVGPVVGRSLVTAYAAVARHYDRTRGESRNVMCYSAAPSPFDPCVQAEQILIRIEQLEGAKARGTLLPEVIAMAEADIAREIIILRLGQEIIDAYAEDRQIRGMEPFVAGGRLKDSTLNEATRPKPDDAAKEAARIIIEMETQDDFAFRKRSS